MCASVTKQPPAKADGFELQTESPDCLGIRRIGLVALRKGARQTWRESI
jgi:hypothetical protein